MDKNDMDKIMQIWEVWEASHKTLTLYIERENPLGLELGLEDYYMFLGRFEENETRNAKDMVANLLHHGYKCRGVDADGLVGTVAVFLS